MKITKIWSLFLLLSSFFVHANKWRYVDYDLSMNMREYGFVIASEQINMRGICGISNAEFNTFFKSLYERNNFLRVQPGNTLKIPKKIHQIWLGGPVPDAFKAYMKSWQDKHPDWQYYLWTDENVHEVTLYNQAYFDQSAGNYGVQSDLLKWELIYQFGGLYVDVDFECLQPLDEFHYAYDFYTGIQPLDTRYVQLGAALFAAAPGNPILKHCIETIADDWHHQHTVIKTGPVHFTKSFYQVAGKSGALDVAFPAHYFYPLGSAQIELKREEWIAHGAYAVHHWAKSWINPLFRPQQFRVLTQAEQWMGADFDEIAQTDFLVPMNDNEAYRVLGERTEVFIDLCRSLYDMRNLSKIDLKFHKIRVPKIIHQIWLDDEIPADIESAMQTWQDAHKGWDYRLWRDSDIQALQKKSLFLYDHAWNRQQKMQVARYEILSQFGGVVIDAALACEKDLTLLHHAYDFYAALSPIGKHRVCIDAAVIGAIAHHPIIEQALQMAAELFYGQKVEDDGSYHMTRWFMRTIGQVHTADIVLPASYFYVGGTPESFARPLLRK